MTDFIKTGKELKKEAEDEGKKRSVSKDAPVEEMVRRGTDAEVPAQDQSGAVSHARRFVAFAFDAVLLLVTWNVTGSLIVAGVIFGVYATISLSVAGRTLGKALLGLQVQQEDGSTLSWPVALLRSTVGYLASSFLLLGFLNVLIDPRRRAWHDLLFHSQVTQDPGRVSASRLIRQLDRWSEQIDEWRQRQLAIFDRLKGLWGLVTSCTSLLTRALGSAERLVGVLAGALGIAASSGAIMTAPAALVAIAAAGATITIGNGIVQVVPSLSPAIDIISGFEPGEVTVKDVELKGNSVTVVLEFKNTSSEERYLGPQWWFGRYSYDARLVDEATSNEISATNAGGDVLVSRDEFSLWSDKTLAPGKSLDRWWTFEVENARGRQFKLVLQGVKETFHLKVN